MKVSCVTHSYTKTYFFYQNTSCFYLKVMYCFLQQNTISPVSFYFANLKKSTLLLKFLCKMQYNIFKLNISINFKLLI